MRVMGFAAFSVWLVLGARFALSATADQCATDGTLEVCVVSAAITPSADRYFNGDIGVEVSVALRITNMTSSPIALAFDGNAMSFMPVNAPAVTSAPYPSTSGMTVCVNSCNDPLSKDFTTFSPGKSLSVQVSFTGRENRGSIDALRRASRGVLSATLSIIQAGRQRLIPLPAPEFALGNGLIKS